MYQIELTLEGVLKCFNDDYEASTISAPDDDARAALIAILTQFSNQPVSFFQAEKDNRALIGYGATIVFLRVVNSMSVDDLKKTDVGYHRNNLVAYLHPVTQIPIWRLSALDNCTLVQMGMIWQTKIDFSLQGLLTFWSIAPEQQTYDTVRSLLTQYSNEPESAFQNLAYAVLLGKLGLITFLLRWKYRQDQLKTMSTKDQRQLLVDENYWRTGIAYQFLSGESAKRAYQRFVPYSDKALVEVALGWYVINKPYVTYNQVSWVTAHDSFTGDKEYLGFDASRDQNNNIDQQLASGIRAVRISADHDGELVHGHLKGGAPATDFGSLEGYLTRIKNFLDDETNKNEIITIIDESNGSDGISKIYTDCIGNYLFYPKTTGDNTPGDWPTIDHIRDGIWPTIKELVAQNKRVIVLHDENYDPNTPWRLHSYDGTNNNFLLSMDKDDYGLSEDYQYRPPFRTVQNDNSKRWNPNNHLYLINHYFYTHVPIIGDDTSKRSYSGKWGNAELVVEYAMLAWWQTGRKPNFIHVDFYDLPWVYNNFVFDLAAALNRPDAYGPFEVPYLIDAQKPIMIMDTFGAIDNKERQALRLGQTYTITCQAYKPDREEDNPHYYNIARSEDADGAAINLAPANSADVKQHWKIAYNTPRPGFALTSPDGEFALYDPNWNDPNRNIKSDKPMLILKTLQGNQEGTGMAMKALKVGLYLYKSDMFVGDNTEDLNKFNQELSLWQVVGASEILGDKPIIGRWEEDGNTVNNMNQRWLFSPIDGGDTLLSDWKVYPNMTANGGVIIVSPDSWNHGSEDVKPTLTQELAYANSIAEVIYFCDNQGYPVFYGDQTIQLFSDPGVNSYVRKGYKET